MIRISSPGVVGLIVVGGDKENKVNGLVHRNRYSLLCAVTWTTAAFSLVKNN